MELNIKKVGFSFDTTSVMERVLETTSIYRPSKVARELSEHFNFQNPAMPKGDVALYLNFASKPRDEIGFTVFERIDYSLPDCDMHRQAQMLADFTIVVADAVGSRDWAYYLKHKTSLGADVRSPDVIKVGETIISNFHDVLAAKLKKKLEEKGLRHTWADSNDAFPEVGMEAALLGIVLDHHEMSQNPDSISRRLGFR